MKPIFIIVTPQMTDENFSKWYHANIERLYDELSEYHVLVFRGTNDNWDFKLLK